METAIFNNDFKKARHLVESGAPISQNTKQRVCECGTMKQIKWMYSCIPTTPSNVTLGLAVAIHRGWLELMKWFIKLRRTHLYYTDIKANYVNDVLFVVQCKNIRKFERGTHWDQSTRLNRLCLMFECGLKDAQLRPNDIPFFLNCSLFLDRFNYFTKQLIITFEQRRCQKQNIIKVTFDSIILTMNVDMRMIKQFIFPHVSFEE